MLNIDLDALEMLLRDNGWTGVGSGTHDPLDFLKAKLGEVEDLQDEVRELKNVECDNCGDLEREVRNKDDDLAALRRELADARAKNAVSEPAGPEAIVGA